MKNKVILGLVIVLLVGCTKESINQKKEQPKFEKSVEVIEVKNENYDINKDFKAIDSAGHETKVFIEKVEDDQAWVTTIDDNGNKTTKVVDLVVPESTSSEIKRKIYDNLIEKPVPVPTPTVDE